MFINLSQPVFVLASQRRSSLPPFCFAAPPQNTHIYISIYERAHCTFCTHPLYSLIHLCCYFYFSFQCGYHFNLFHFTRALVTIFVSQRHPLPSLQNTHIYVYNYEPARCTFCTHPLYLLVHLHHYILILFQCGYHFILFHFTHTLVTIIISQRHHLPSHQNIHIYIFIFMNTVTALYARIRYFYLHIHTIIFLFSF